MTSIGITFKIFFITAIIATTSVANAFDGGLTDDNPSQTCIDCIVVPPLDLTNSDPYHPLDYIGAASTELLSNPDDDQNANLQQPQ